MNVVAWPNEEAILNFMRAVNSALISIDLEKESIDYSMAATYLKREYNVDQAVDDICSTHNIVNGED